MLKDVTALLDPDPFFGGTAGFIGSTIEGLHADMVALSLPQNIPENIRRVHDGIRHAYIYAFFSYDLLTVAQSRRSPASSLLSGNASVRNLRVVLTGTENRDLSCLPNCSR